MSGILIGVYGASGFGREVMPLVKAFTSDQMSKAELIFVDDGIGVPEINSRRVLTYDDFLRVNARSKFMVVSIANSQVRREIFSKLRRDRIDLLNIAASNVVIMDEVRLGPGAILSPFVTLTSNISIGEGFHANIYSYIGHDCVIGDFVTFAPAVKCNGNVWIADHAYIGTGAIIKQGRPGKPLIIGEGAIVGMGAVVTKNVPAGTTVIGNPAKPLCRAGLRGGE